MRIGITFMLHANPFASMILADLPPRVVVLLAALALVPVAIYGLSRSASAGVVAGINVLLVLAALRLATRAAAGGEAGTA